MKSFEINRGAVGAGIVPITPGGLPVIDKPRVEKAPLTTEPSATAPLAQGLVKSAPSLDQQGSVPATSAADVLQSQQVKADAPHRRGRTAALRVRDVKSEADVTTKRAFKGVLDLVGPLQDALAQHGIKR